MSDLIDPADKRRWDTVEAVEILPEEKPTRLHVNYILARCPILGFMRGTDAVTLIAKEDLEKTCA